MHDMCHDLQIIGDSYFPKNKPPKVVIDGLLFDENNHSFDY
jgi:hypothetical protein